MTFLLALDQSTSATKAVLFDSSGRVVDRASLEHRQLYPRPGWVEHDPEEIWKNALAVIRELVSRNAGPACQLDALSITNQRETILVWERATGRPLHNAIVWQCRRGDPLCQKLRADGREDVVRAKTGLKVDSYFSASKLAWLVHENPELAVKLKNGTAVAGTIDAYLVHRLTGAPATDHTNASRTLLFDVGKLRWDEELCDLFDVPVRCLPEVRESGADFGQTDCEGSLPRKVPIRGVMGDSQASLFAQRCFRDGTAKATFGTGTSVLLNIGERFRLADKGAVTALAWVCRGNPAYAFEGLVNFSSATITWLRDQLGLLQNAADAGALASAVPDNAGVYLVPAFAGLSAPYWSADARAAIVGMTAYTRREHVVRAGEEAIAYQIRDVLEMMRAGGNVNLTRLHADGGPTRDAFLMQFTADITGLELRVSETPESSAWGAASIGLLGTGASFEQLERLPREVRIYRPQMETAAVQSLYDGWQAAVKRVL